MGAIRASDILSYRPNAESGYDGSGAPNVAPVAPVFSDFSRALRDIERDNANFSAMQYQQAVKDRENSLRAFSEADIDFPVEPEDKAQLEGTYNDIKKTMLKYNGNPTARPEGRIEMQENLSRFKSKKAIGQARHKAASEQRIAIAKELDDDMRKRRIQHLESQLATTDKIPDPFPEEPIYKVDEVLYKPAAKIKGTPELKRRADGTVWEKSTTYFDPKEIIEHYEMPNVIGNKDKYYLDKLGLYSRDLVNNDAFTEDVIKDMNTRLDEINKKNNFIQGDRYFQDPVKWEYDKDNKMVIKDTPADFAKKIALYTYGDREIVSEQMSKEGQAAYKTLAQEKQAIASANKSNTDAARIAAITAPTVEKLKAEAERARQQGNNEMLKGITLQQQTLEPAATMVNAFEKIDGFIPIERAKKNPNLDRAIKDSGLSGNLEVTEISNPDIKKALSRPAYNETLKSGVKTRTRLKGAAEPPKRIVAVRPVGGGVGDYVLVGIYGDKTTKAINVKSGASELLNAQSDFSGNQQIVQKMGVASGVVDELLKAGASEGAEEVDIEDGVYEADGVRYRVTGGVVEEISEEE